MAHKQGENARQNKEGGVGGILYIPVVVAFGTWVLECRETRSYTTGSNLKLLAKYANGILSLCLNKNSIDTLQSICLRTCLVEDVPKAAKCHVFSPRRQTIGRSSYVVGMRRDARRRCLMERPERP